MYNPRNSSTNKSSSRPYATSSGNRSANFNRSESGNRAERPSYSDHKKSDFLSTPVKREASSENRRPASNYGERSNSNSRGSSQPSDRGGYNRSESAAPSRSFGESSFGGRKNFGSARSGGGQRHFGGANRGGGGRGGRFAKHLDESLFMQDAQPIAEQVAYVPSFVFNDLAVSNILLDNIAKKGFVDPTPIQDQTIPHILDGKDIVGIANTGTGKTGAFLIPLVEKVIKGRHNKILILVPTRELAEQIEEELFILTRELRIFSVKCIGGDSIQKQIYQLRRGYNFIIGTPGRVEDLIDRRMIDLASFKTIVLDEVDRMLDMGFVDEIKEVIAMLPQDKQSLFFSATVDNKVEALMRTILKPDFIKVSVKTGVTSHNIQQDVVYYSDFEEKIEKMEKTLLEYKEKRVLIFVNTKHEVDKVDDYLYKGGFAVTAIHGDKRQNYRKKAIDSFKSGKIDILVATDVAARGLDIPAVALVLNYDVPNNHEDYIHRIGRTGRANLMGNAITFVKRNGRGR